MVLVVSVNVVAFVVPPWAQRGIWSIGLLANCVCEWYTKFEADGIGKALLYSRYCA